MTIRLIYLDADAKMDTYQAADGSNQTRLNLVQRESSCLLLTNSSNECTGSFETLSRPRSALENRDAAEEPLSGVGAS